MNPAAMQPMQDPNAQWLAAVLSLRQELRFETRSEQGRSFVVIEDPVRNKFFRIGLREYLLISAIDGQKSMGEIGQQCEDKTLDDALVSQVTQWLIQNNLAFSNAMDSSKRINTQASSLDKAALMGKLNPLSFKIKLFNPTRALDVIYPVAQWMFSKAFLAIWCVVALMALRVIWTQWDAMGSASTGILSNFGWVWMLLFWLLLKIIHEAAHGVACRKYGGEVPEAGVLMLLFTPMAYVNVTSMWRFANRWQRIVVAAAGMYVELFVAFLCIILWSRSEGLLAATAFQIFLMASVTTILFNANPLMRFDGYFMLADTLGVANLYTKGTKWFGDRLKSLFLGTPKTPNLFPVDEFWRCSIYGTLAFAWKILISISLTIGASVLLPNFGIFLATIGAAIWIGMPLYQQYQQTVGSKAKHPVSPKRVAISAAVLVVAGMLMFFVLAAPATKSAPALVQFANETILRAESPGFIDEIHVRSGNAVKEGDLLVRLRNQELLDELEVLKNDVDGSRIQVRIHQQAGELGLASVEEERLYGLEKQLLEKTQMAQSLEVRAPFDGFVFERKLANLQGQFVDQGDPVLKVAQHRRKEVIVSMDQRDLDSVKANQGQEIRVLISGMPIFQSRFSNINPRATTSTTHPSLCSFAGGTLPVRGAASSDSADGPSFELLSPRFTAKLELEDEVSQTLHSGQRGLAFFKNSRQSMGSYLYLAACDWLENKIQLAMQVQ